MIQTEIVPPPPPSEPAPDNVPPSEHEDTAALFKPTHVQTLSIAPPPVLPRPPAYSYASTAAPDDDDRDGIENNGISKREKVC